MGRVTKAQLEGVEADRDQLRDQLVEAQGQVDRLKSDNDWKDAIIAGLNQASSGDSEYITSLESELDKANEQARDAIEAVVAVANETITVQDNQIDFLTNSLISIASYRGPNPGTIRGLAIAGLADFVDEETLKSLV